MRIIIVLALLAGATFAHAQTADPTRIIELEEQVRRLNGRVEEMNFQLLQYEETLRKMREEYELRFQELEEASEEKDSGSIEAPAGEAERDTADAEGEDRLGKSTQPAEADDAASEARSEPDGTPRRGEPPRMLGSLTFDADGNLVGAEEARRIAREEVISNAADRPEPGSGGAMEAARAFGETPDAVFAAGRSALEAGDSEGAARILEAHANAWPDEGRRDAVQSVRGDALFQAKRYAAAADTLLDLYDRDPNAPNAGRTLFTLGLSLAGLDQREIACATYAQVLQRYGGSDAALRDEVAAAQASARC